MITNKSIQLDATDMSYIILALEYMAIKYVDLGHRISQDKDKYTKYASEVRNLRKAIQSFYTGECSATLTFDEV